MGRLKKLPKVLTPDMVTANEVVNHSGFDKVEFGVLDYEPIVLPSFPFDYENDINALKRLYKQHKLDDIISDDMSALDIQMALMKYTCGFLKDGAAPSAESWMNTTSPSAFAITKQRRRPLAFHHFGRERV